MYSFKQRLTILGFLAVLFLAAYGLGKQYSPAIVSYVVGEALVQKAPAEIGAFEARRAFDEWLGQKKTESKLMYLLELSRFLEKVQKLTPEEFRRLLANNERVRKLEFFTGYGYSG